MPVTGDPLSELTIVQVDAASPGTLLLTLDEHLSCPHCHHSGPQWQITLAPERPEPPTIQHYELRREDPGG